MKVEYKSSLGVVVREFDTNAKVFVPFIKKPIGYEKEYRDNELKYQEIIEKSKQYKLW